MKLKLIYYKCLLDVATRNLFASINDQFTKDESGHYVFSGQFSSKLEKLFFSKLRDAIDNFAPVESNSLCIVIGSCYPKDNLLLSFKDNRYFPKKLSGLIESRPALKYILKEDDIDVDIGCLNQMFNGSFCKMFADSRCISKILKTNRKDIIFMAHRKIDCYAMFKTIKWAFGSSNCVNVWKTSMQDVKPCLIAVNDLVSKYIANKTAMNKSKDFKAIALEVKSYLDEKIRSCIGA